MNQDKVLNKLLETWAIYEMDECCKPYKKDENLWAIPAFHSSDQGFHWREVLIRYDPEMEMYSVKVDRTNQTTYHDSMEAAVAAAWGRDEGLVIEGEP